MSTEQELRQLIRAQNLEYICLEPSEFVVAQAKCTIPTRHTHHLRKVTRHKGDVSALLGNGEGQFILCTISVNNELLIKKQLSLVCNPNQVVLWQAAIKEKPLEWLVQKTTELGVSEVVLFKSQHTTQTKVSQHRMSLIIENAMMQSLNFFRPKLQITDVTLTRLFNSELAKSQNVHIFFGDVFGEQGFTNFKPIHPTSVFINGPEGGFSSDEVVLLKQYATALNLSKQVLRAETAGVCAVQLLKALTL